MQQPSPVQPSIAQLRGQQENVIVASIAVVDKESSSTFGLAAPSWKEKKRFRLTNQRSSYYSQKNTNVCFYRPLFPPTMYHNSAQCQRQPHMYFLVVMKIKRTFFKIDMSRPQFIQNTWNLSM